MKLWLPQILLILLLFLSGSEISSISTGEPDRGDSYGCSTFLVINGESNINRFSFSFLNRPDSPAGNFIYHSRHNGTEILIPWREFQASNPRMYNDFLQQVNEREYPYIAIFLPRFEPDSTGALKSGSEQKVLITVAGVAKQYTIKCDLVNCGDHLTIKGSEKIRLTDFGISPPGKFNGLIKVRNEMTVSFGIILNFISVNTYAGSQ